MLSWKKILKKQLFSGFSSFNGSLVRFSIKIDVLALTFTESLCLVLLRADEKSPMPWLYGKKLY